MRPVLRPSLVNGRYGDPALYIEAMFERRAFMLDLGDITPLWPRKLLRLEHIFVSHTHIDHFVGFDRLLRVLVGRDTKINLYGPAGFIDQVGHKLQAYCWNLANRYLSDLIFVVTEIDSSHRTKTARFRLKSGFHQEEVDAGRVVEATLHNEPAFRVRTAILEHYTPSLGFAIEEAAHVNVWKNRLADMGIPVGPWLRELKRAVIDNRPADYPITIGSPQGTSGGRVLPLAALRPALTVAAGQKIAYVTDVADTIANREAIVRLARNADLLFIEAAFAQADAALAAERGHLTTLAAGQIARQAKARKVEPFHFSPRYVGEEERMLKEVMAAFRGA